MKEIQITNGKVILKDFCTRKLKKEINAALLADADVKTVDGKAEMSNFTMKAMEKANDIALVGLTEKVIINDVESEPTVELFDSLDERDVQKVLVEVNKMTYPEQPKK